MGQRRRARRRSEGAAAAAEVCRRLDDRPARRCPRDAGGLSHSRGGDARIQVLRGADELHRGQIHPGRRGSAGHSRRRASRHRLHAIAAAAAAPDRVLVRAGDEQITDTGANQGKARSQRSAGAARARWLARRLRSGSGGSRLPAGNGAARAGGIGADHLDALHGQRQRDDGSDERRAGLRQRAAQARGGGRPAAERELHAEGRRGGYARRRRDDAAAGRHAVERAAAHARAGQAVGDRDRVA